MSIVSGVVCSVARVLDLAAAFAGAPVSDTTLFPLGALDKLVSLRQYVLLLSLTGSRARSQADCLLCAQSVGADSLLVPRVPERADDGDLGCAQRRGSRAGWIAYDQRTGPSRFR